MSNDRDSAHQGLRILARLRAWRDEPWEMRPFFEQPRSYRMLFVVYQLALVAGSALAWYAMGIGAGAASIPLVTGSIAVTVFVCLHVYRHTDSVQAGVDEKVAIPLLLAGHPAIALLCILAGRVVQTAKKPIHPHLAIANVVNGFAVVIGAVTLMNALAGDAQPATLRWLVGAYWSVTLAQVAVGALVTWTLVLGGYLRANEVARYEWLDLRSRLTTSVPLVVVIGAVLAANPSNVPLLALLLLPHFVLDDATRSVDRLVDAQTEAEHDPLTGLPNRRALWPMLEGSVAAAGRGTPTWFAVIDLDNFKQLNDRHGHSAGDHAIREAGLTVRELVAPVGDVARFGGDEFVAAMTGLEEQQVVALCERIRAEITDRLGFMGVGASIGAHRVLVGDTARSALNNADVAMYRAKGIGRGITMLSTDSVPSRGAIDGGGNVSSVAGRYIDSGHEDAIAYWRSLATRCRAERDDWGLARALYQQYRICDQGSAPGREHLESAAAVDAGQNGWAMRAHAALLSIAGDLDGAVDRDRRALELARSYGDVGLEIVALLALGHGYALRGDVEAAVALSQSAREIAVLHSSTYWELECFRTLFDLLVASARLTDAAHLCEATERNLEPRDANLGAVVLVRLGMLAVFDGRIDDAQALRHRTIELQPPPSDRRFTELCTLLGAVVDHESSEPGESIESEVDPERRWRLAGGLLDDLLALGERLDSSSDPRAAEERATLARRWHARGFRIRAACELARAVPLLGRERWPGEVERAREWRYAIATSGAGHTAALLDRSSNEVLTLTGASSIDLAGSSLFAGIPEPVTARIAAEAQMITLHSGEQLFAEGDACASVHVIVDGALALHRRLGNGKSPLIAVRGRGSATATWVLDRAVSSPVRAVALVDCTVARISESALLDHVRSKDVADALSTSGQTEHEALLHAAERSAARSVRQRLASLLIDLDAALGRDTISRDRVVDLALPQEVLADMLATSRQALHTARRSLEHDGLLSMRRKCFVLHDLVGLARLVEDDDQGARRSRAA